MLSRRAMCRSRRLSPRRAARPRAGKVALLGVAPRALSAILIALVLLCGQSASLLHFLLVPHAACEHGELIELPTAPRAAPADERQTEVAVKGAAPGDGEHEHCNERARLHRLEGIGASVGEASLLSIEPRAPLRE